MTLLAETLAAIPLPGSMDLIIRLLDVLNNVLHYDLPSQGDKNYMEQLIMSTVENVAEKIIVCTDTVVILARSLINLSQDIPNLSPSSIRLDVLVELIRGKSLQTMSQEDKC